MFLELNGLVKRFGGQVVINDLSLCVGQGELVCLLGSSGCGKTTTLRMVGGYLHPDKGHICLDGSDITRLPPEERPVSTVFQSYALFPHLSVAQNVAYGLKFKGVGRAESRSRALGMLEVVGMEAYADARVDEISGGQQQRVALARSLVLDPKVLLLDEPLSNLDAGLRDHMRGEVKRIQRDMGVTMLFVTHDREEAMTLSDRIAILHEGLVEQVGMPEEVYSHPATEHCARFMGPLNAIDEAGEIIRFRPEDVRIAERGRGRFSGFVAHGTFLGDHREYRVDVPGSSVTLRCDKDMRLAEGDPISFDVTHVTSWRT